MRESISSPHILERGKLLKQDLLDLVNGKILVLRVYPFIDEETCRMWQKPLENSNDLSRYSNAQDVSVNRIGMTLFEAENKPQKLLRYFESAKSTFTTIEKLLRGDNPIKDIQHGINRIWKNGSAIEQLNGRSMNPGIIRSFESSKDGGLPPHMDSLAKDVPNSTPNPMGRMSCQLAANLYINTSQKGGELEIWNYTPSLEKLKSLQNGSHDFIDRNKIPTSSRIIRPRIGELILFRSNCIHSVLPSSGGMRTTASCFIGYYDENKPLTLWG